LVAENVGTVPGMVLLFTSLRVMVTVEVARPLATTGPVPVMLELAATAAPGVKTTVPSALLTGVTMLKVLDSAFVDVKVQVDTPEEFVLEQVP